MDAEAREKLKELVAVYGPALQDDARRTKALLLDTCPTHRREVAVLVAAAEEGIPGRLNRAASVTSFGRDIERLSAQLEQDRSLTRDAARWAVQSWAWAYDLGPPPVDALASDPPASIPTDGEPPPLRPPPTDPPAPRPPIAAGGGEQPRNRPVPARKGVIGAAIGGLVVVAVVLALIFSAEPSAPTTETVTTIPATPNTPAPSAAPPGGVETDLVPDRAGASSTADPGVDAAGSQVSYEITNIADGDNETAWRTPGDGIGETVTLEWDREVHLTGISMVPGYDKVDPGDGADRFLQNRRVLAVEYRFSDGSTARQTFEDSRERQGIAVDVATTSVEVVILDTTDAPDRDFTAISEISFRGWEVG
jgi:hypothetical protein